MLPHPVGMRRILSLLTAPTIDSTDDSGFDASLPESSSKESPKVNSSESDDPSSPSAKDVLGVEDVDRLVELLGNFPHVRRPRPRPLAPRIFLFLLLLLLLYHVFPQVSGEGPGWKKDEGGCLEATVGLLVLLVVA